MANASVFYEDLVAYLKQCRAHPPARPVLVLGHAAPDTDAVISSVTEAYLRYKTEHIAAVPVVDAVRLPREVAWLTEEVGEALYNSREPQVTAWLNDASVPVILTDHHDRDLSPERVMAVVDHHPSVEPMPEREDVLILPVGSTCTLVAQRYFAGNLIPDSRFARLLLGGILADTEGLSPTKTKPADTEAAQTLISLFGGDSTALFSAIREQLLAETDLTVLFERDYREFHGWGFAVLKVWQDTVIDEAHLRRLLEHDRRTRHLTATVAKVTRYTSDGLGREVFYLSGDPDTVTRMRQIIVTAVGDDAVCPTPDTVILSSSASRLSRKRLVPLFHPIFS